MIKTPCNNCPFRTDVKPYLRPQRASEIRDALERGGDFPCHKTVDYSDGEDDGKRTKDSKFCAGALILMEKDFGAVQNQMVRIGSRLGLIDLDELDMDAPVYEDFDGWEDSFQQ